MNDDQLNNFGEILFDNSPTVPEVTKQAVQTVTPAETISPVLTPPTNPTINVSVNKLKIIKHLADNLSATAKQLSELLAVYVADEEIKPARPTVDTTIALPITTQPFNPINTITVPTTATSTEDAGRVIEGIFNGEKMVGPDGQLYDVPVNYASKSKLVEGDMLKLIITERGTFVFKQIQPVERVRTVGILEQGPTGEYYTLVNDRRWRVLGASVSYFHGQPGDEVIMLIPREGSSRWAAVDNIINKK